MKTFKLFFLISLISIPISHAKIQGQYPKWEGIVESPKNIRENSHKVAFLLIRKWDFKKNRFKRKNNGNYILKRCTGFLVAPQIIMTNWHCIKKPNQAIGITAYFRFEQGVPRGHRIRIRCNEFIAHNQDLDYALIKCKKRRYYNMDNPVVIDARPFNVINGYDGVNRSLKNKRSRPMYMIHQQCLGRGCEPYKKYQIDRIRETGAKDAKHDADSLSGTSGAPIFDLETNRVIALHHEGNPTLNQAIPMYKIIKRFKYLSNKNEVYKNLLQKIKFIEN